MYLAYTYLIGWKSHSKYYYGVRYGNMPIRSPEDDFWIHYFTSSNYVKNFREIHGEPDLIRIHRQFSDKKEAIDFEEQMLKKLMDVNKTRWSNNWLNRNIAGCILIDEVIAKKIGKQTSIKLKEIITCHCPKTDKEIRVHSIDDIPEGWVIGQSIHHKLSTTRMNGKKHSIESKRKMSESQKDIGNKPVIVDGKVYKSRNEAAKQIGVAICTIYYWLRSGKAKNYQI